LCLGARAVLIGRPYLYGLAARGPAGVEGVLSILRQEIKRTMTIMGVASIKDLDASYLLPADTTIH
jgi:isopentenyl diphosphate isomerase/L-lactate dehydrogenase-like FMN-dependent dehydrogenase